MGTNIWQIAYKTTVAIYGLLIPIVVYLLTSVFTDLRAMQLDVGTIKATRWTISDAAAENTKLWIAVDRKADGSQVSAIASLQQSIQILQKEARERDKLLLQISTDIGQIKGALAHELRRE